MRKNIELNYINMCKEARELQEIWQPFPDDLIYIINNKKIQTLKSKDSNILYFQSGLNANINECVWLPTQYQLEHLISKYRIFWNFYKFIHEVNQQYLIQFHREDELWLSFFMFYSYKKIWKNNQWIQQN